MNKQIYIFLKLKIIFFRFRKRINYIIKPLCLKIFDSFTKSIVFVSPYFHNNIKKYILKFLKLIIRILEIFGFSFLTKRVISRYHNIKKNKTTPSVKFSPDLINSNQIDYESRLLSFYSSSSQAKRINADLRALLVRRSKIK